MDFKAEGNPLFKKNDNRGLRYEGRPSSLDARGNQPWFFPFDAFTHNITDKTIGVKVPWKFVLVDEQGNPITDQELLEQFQQAVEDISVRPTYEELDEGRDDPDAGLTTVPEAPTVSC